MSPSIEEVLPRDTRACALCPGISPSDFRFSVLSAGVSQHKRVDSFARIVKACFESEVIPGLLHTCYAHCITLRGGPDIEVAGCPHAMWLQCKGSYSAQNDLSIWCRHMLQTSTLPL